MTVNSLLMYKTCPKCGHKRQPSDKTGKDKCPACGLVFRKWLKSLVTDNDLVDPEDTDLAVQSWQKTLKKYFLQPRPGIGKGELVLYLLIWLAFFAWGIDFIRMDFRTNAIGQSWLHNVDLHSAYRHMLLFAEIHRDAS